MREEVMTARKRLTVIVIFSFAMAWVEAACVAYLRTLVHRIEPYQFSPMPALDFLGPTELVREAATLVMLGAAGWLAGKAWRSRFGCFIVAFGTWDVFYYLFLKIIVGWPHTLFDWDILFLIPLPWWGPVFSPILISMLLVVLGTMMTQRDFGGRQFRPRRLSWTLHWCGIVIALYVFMANSLRIVSGGGGSLRTELPTQFNWPLFLVALLLMSVPIVETGIQLGKEFRDREVL
jgi:hypothetical protein